MPITLIVDNSAADDAALEMCHREQESIVPSLASGDPIFVRYKCDRCGVVGEEAFGRMTQMEEVDEAAAALFAGSVVCQAGC
jgi:hypothetical protein